MPKKKIEKVYSYKKDTGKDYLGLAAVIFCLLLMAYLLVENYMGYSGIQTLLRKESEIGSKYNFR